jgi:hypothetical protein
MSNDEIIEMARESGMELYGLGKDRYRFVHHLEAFAKLVAKKAYLDGLENGIKAEREACALIADEWAVGWPHPSQVIAERIRARGQA